MYKILLENKVIIRKIEHSSKYWQ